MIPCQSAQVDKFKNGLLPLCQVQVDWTPLLILLVVSVIVVFLFIGVYEGFGKRKNL